MSNKRNPGKPQLQRRTLNIYFTSSRLSTQPNLSLHNGFLSHPSMYVLLWLCGNGWCWAALEVLRPASVTRVWPRSGLGVKGGCDAANLGHCVAGLRPVFLQEQL